MKIKKIYSNVYSNYNFGIENRVNKLCFSLSEINEKFEMEPVKR